MSKSSLLGRPGSAGSKHPKEPQGNRSCMLRVGERLMRAGSEGNLVQRPRPPQHNRNQETGSGSGQGPAAPGDGLTQSLPLEGRPSTQTGSNSAKDPRNPLPRLPSSSANNSDSDRFLQKKRASSLSSEFSDPPRSPSTTPRRHNTTVSRGSSSDASGGSGTGAGAGREVGGGRDSELDSLLMQQSDVERKKEVFLDHLRQKYPHHAAVIMGHQDRMRKQVRSPRPSASPPLGAGALGLAEQQDPLSVASLESLETTMSEGDVLPATAPFARGCKARASLPIARSASQTREGSLGVLYLQYGEGTKQVRMPNEITGVDTLRALFVSAFPQHLSMKMLESPSVAVYIKDPSRNVYYELQDIRHITSHSCLKVYHKDPAHAFNRHARPSSAADGRISKEVLYGSHSPVHTLQSSSRSALHNLQGSMSPPMVRSMPSSPSRISYGGTRGSTGSIVPGSVTLPRERLSGRTVTPCSSSSVILERRDVKPDEDLGSNKSMSLVVRGDRGPHYPDSYCSSSLHDGSASISIASSQSSALSSLTADVVDTGGGGLQQYRASVKPLVAYGETLEHQNQSLHRQKPRNYSEGQLPPLGTKSPPASPHRLIDGQVIGGVGLVSLERMSPIRRSLRRDSNGAIVEVVNRTRGSGSTSSSSSVFVDSPLGHPDRLFQGHVVAADPQSERMKAMEAQIASLAGLVQHALTVGPNVAGVKDIASESDGRTLLNNRPGVSPAPGALSDGHSPAPLVIQAPPPDIGLQQSFAMAKRNVSELRLQLNQLKQLQVANQESVSSMLRMAGQELSGMMCERLAQYEETGFRQRAEMEEERINYLTMQERVLLQLRDLEEYVDCLKRHSASSPGQLSVTLKDVEQGAVNLRRVGEALAALKGEFPELQLKMRSVLRVEVEAVRFLKEEPHTMDNMLKRVKALTEALSVLRRCVSESHPHFPDSMEREPGPLRSLTPQGSPKPQPRSSVRPPLPSAPSSGARAEAALAAPASLVMAQRVRSSPAAAIQSPHHHPSPPLTPSHARDSPTVAKVSPRSRENSPALQKRVVPFQAEGHTPSVVCSTETVVTQPATASTEAPAKQTEIDSQTTERETPEGSQSEVTLTTPQNDPNLPCTASQPDPNTSQPQSTTATSSHPIPPSTTDFDQILQDAQANLMRSIPDLEVSDPRGEPSPLATGKTAPAGAQSEQREAPPLDPTRQAVVDQPAEPPLEQTAVPETVEKEPPKLPDEVDTPLPRTTAPVAPAEAPQPAPVPTEPSAVPPSSAGRLGRPMVEKPRRPSVERERGQSPDKAGKSPPPPPPRRFYPTSAGLTTGRSGEVIFTTRKEPVEAQDEDSEEVMAPQPKPPRQPPEVKPKPQNPHATPSPGPASATAPTLTTTSATAPTLTTTSAPAPTPAPVTTTAVDEEDDDDEEEEDEEEDDKFMKELQVFQKCSLREVGTRCVVDLSTSDPQSREIDPKIQLWRDNPLFNTEDNSSNTFQSHRVMYYVTGQLVKDNSSSRGKDQQEDKERALPASQVANQNPPELTPHPELITSDQLAPQTGTEVAANQDGCSDKPMTESGVEERTMAEKHAMYVEKEEESVPAEKLESQTVVALENVTTLDIRSPDQKEGEQKEEVEEEVEEKEVAKQEPASESALADRSFAFPTVATLDKENVPTPDVDSTVWTGQKKKEEAVTKPLPSPTSPTAKSHLTIVVTLERENVPLCPHQKEEEETVAELAPAPESAPAEKSESPTARKENILTLDSKSPNQKREVEEEATQMPALKSPPPEKKSNITIVVTLQKENVPTDGSSGTILSKSPQVQPETSPALKPALPPLSLTDRQGSQPQHEEAVRESYRDQYKYTEEGSSLSPDLDDEGPPPPPPDRMAFRISKSRVKALSKGEYQDLKANSSEMQTVTVGNDNSNNDDTANDLQGEQGGESTDDFDKKTLILIFDEPMDMNSAWKRLSTIFEFEEDLHSIPRLASFEGEEEERQEEGETSLLPQIQTNEVKKELEVTENTANSQRPQHTQHERTSSDCRVSSNDDQSKTDSPSKAETKKKFKFKFPKNKLAAISQAIRMGTSKTGKKTLEVVVYEEEEEITSGNGMVKETTKKETKETKRFEINNIKQQTDLGQANTVGNDNALSPSSPTKSHTRTEELCKNAYDSINSLEESIKQLEISVDSMAMSSPSSPIAASPTPPLNSPTTEEPRRTNKVKREREGKRDREGSPSKRPAPQTSKGLKPPQSKKAKPQTPKETVATTAKKQTSGGTSPFSSRLSLAKSRHSSSSGSPEKAAKGQQNLQDSQRQFRQANSRGARSATPGDSNHSSLALPASKIPAFCHSPGKHPSSSSLSAPYCSNVLNNPPNLPSSSSSSSSTTHSSSASSSSSSSGKHPLLSPPSKSASRSSCPSVQRSAAANKSLLSPPGSQASNPLLSPHSTSSGRYSSSLSPPGNSPCRSPSPTSHPSSSSSSPHKSYIPSLNLSRLLPSSSHASSTSHASANPRIPSPSHGSRSDSNHHHLSLSTSSPSSHNTRSAQYNFNSSSSYSSSSSSSSSSSTNSSLSPSSSSSSSSSSPPSPSPSSLLPTLVSQGARSIQTSLSATQATSSTSHGKLHASTGQGSPVTHTPARASKDIA